MAICILCVKKSRPDCMFHVVSDLFSFTKSGEAIMSLSVWPTTIGAHKRLAFLSNGTTSVLGGFDLLGTFWTSGDQSYEWFLGIENVQSFTVRNNAISFKCSAQGNVA